VGRMRGLDQSLKARDAADKAAKQSQVLWAACQALLRAIKTGCPGIPWKDQLRPLSPEITLVRKAAGKWGAPSAGVTFAPGVKAKTTCVRINFRDRCVFLSFARFSDGIGSALA
jgi:hypothetical protein